MEREEEREKRKKEERREGRGGGEFLIHFKNKKRVTELEINVIENSFYNYFYCYNY